MGSKGFKFLILISACILVCSAQLYADVPANDNFTDAIEITTLSGSTTGTNVEATAEGGEPRHADVKGGTSVWWVFTTANNAAVSIDTSGSDFNNILAVYTGTSVAALTEVASNSGGTTSSVSFDSEYQTTYYIAVDGPGKLTGNIVLNWNVIDNDDIEGAVELASNLSGTSSGINTDATLQIGEPAHAGNTGGASVWWEWTAPVTGTVTFDTASSNFDTTLAMYVCDINDPFNTIVEVASNDNDPNAVDGTSWLRADVEGGVTYYIAVDGYNDGTSVQTGDVVLNYSLVFNDDFADAYEFTGPSGNVALGYNNNFATTEVDEPSHAGSGPNASVWWYWTATSTGKLAIDATASAINSSVAVYTGTSVEDLTQVAAGQDAVIADVVEGVTYYIAVDSSDGATGDIIFSYTTTNNDMFADASKIVGTSGTATSISSLATKEIGESYHAGAVGGKSVWWKWTATIDTIMVFDTFGTDFDTVLAVYTGTSVDALTEVASNDDSNDEFQSIVTFIPTIGTTYYIAVDDYDNVGGDVVLNWADTYNDYIADAIELTTTQGTVGAKNTSATKEDGEPDHAGNEGGASVWWYLTPSTTGFITLDTYGSDCNTLLAVYEGPTPPASVGDLNEIASNDNDPNMTDGTSLIERVLVEAGNTYYIVVDGVNGETGNLVLNWVFGYNDLFEYAFEITGSTGSVSGNNTGATSQTGEPVHGDVTPMPNASLWWYWTAPVTAAVTFDTFDCSADTVLGVYTGDSIDSLTPVPYIDADDYRDDAPDSGDPNNLLPQSQYSFDVEIGQVFYIAVDDKGSPASSDVTLKWNMEFNDNFADADILSTNKGQIEALNIGATAEENEPAHNGVAAMASVWWKWTSPMETIAHFQTAGIYTNIAVYTGDALDSLAEVASGADVVSLEVSADTDYYIAVDSQDQSQFTFIWNIDYNDDFVDALAIDITETSGEQEANNESATLELPFEEFIANQLPTGTMWWSWTAPSNVTAIFDASGSNFDALLAVYESSLDNPSINDLDLVGYSNDGDTVEFAASGGTTYYVVVAGRTGQTGDMKLAWEFVMSDVDNPFVIDPIYSVDDSSLIFEQGGFNNDFAETVEGTPNIAGHSPEHPIAVLWHPLTSGQATVNVVASFPTVMSVYRVYTQTSPSEIPTLDVEDLVGSNFVTATDAQPNSVSFEVLGYDEDDGTSYEGFGVYQWYIFLIDGRSGYTGDITVQASVEMNDDLAHAFDLNTPTQYIDLSYGGQYYGGYTTGINNGADMTILDVDYQSSWVASAEPNEPNHLDTQVADRSIWFTWTAQSNSRVRFSTEESNISSVMRVYYPTDPNTLNPVTMEYLTPVTPYNSNYTNDTTIFDATAGQTYYIAADSLNPTEYGTIDLVWQYNFNDFFVDAYTITGPGYSTETSFTTFASGESYEPGLANASVWWNWVPTTLDGIVVFDTVGSNFDTLLYMYENTTGEIDDLVLVDENDNLSDFNSLSEIAVDLSEYANDPSFSGVFSLCVDGYGTGDVQLNWYTITNDDFLDATAISGISGSVEGSNRFTTVQPYEPSHAEVDCGNTVWWVWTPTISGNVTIDTSGTAFDTVLAVYTGSNIRQAVEVASNDDVSSTDTTSSVTFYATKGVPCRIVVSGKNNGSGVESGWIILNYAAQEYFTLSIYKDGQGYVDLNGLEYTLPIVNQVFLAGTVIDITALPDSSWGFDKWSMIFGGSEYDITTDAAFSFMLDGDIELVANFVNRIDQFEFAQIADTWDANGFDLVTLPDETAWFRLDDPNLVTPAIDLQSVVAEPDQAYNGTLKVDYSTDLYSTDAVYDQCLVLAGEPNNFVEVPVVLNPASTSFGAFAWVRFEGTDITDRTILAQGNGNNPVGDGRRWLYSNAVDGVGLSTELQTDGGSGLQSDFDFSDGQWHHIGIVVIQDASTFSRYLFGDGKLVAWDLQPLEGTIESTIGSMLIGSDKSLAPSRLWIGSIDDLRIYDNVLSFDPELVADQVAAIALGPDGPASVVACVEDYTMDLNDDCLVNLEDLVILASQWLQYQ